MPQEQGAPAPAPNLTLREDMHYLLGMLNVLRYPLLSIQGKGVESVYLDFIEDVVDRYKDILKRVLEAKE